MRIFPNADFIVVYIRTKNGIFPCLIWCFFKWKNKGIFPNAIFVVVNTQKNLNISSYNLLNILKRKNMRLFSNQIPSGKFPRFVKI